MTDFDTTSTDAMHWAEAFVEHKERNDWTLEDIDEGLMVAWFANYWSAVIERVAVQGQKEQSE